MKLISKSIINAQILAHYIGVDPSSFFHQLSTLGIVNNACWRESSGGIMMTSPSKSVTPGFKNKTRYTPYVSPGSQISHIATNKGNIK
jgi:hypothetical protein